MWSKSQWSIEMLVVPDDLARGRINRQRAVVIQVLLVVAAQQVLGPGRCHRRADVKQLELGVVARRHPCAHVLAFAVGHIAPALVARLAGTGNRARAPQLLARRRIMRGDHAVIGIGAGNGFAAATGEHLAIGDDGTGGLMNAALVIEHLRRPHILAGARVQRIERAIGGGVDDEIAVDRRDCD